MLCFFTTMNDNYAFTVYSHLCDLLKLFNTTDKETIKQVSDSISS